MNLCDQISLEKSLYPNKAYFYYKTKDSDMEPIPLETITVRGSKSGYSAAYNIENDALNLRPSDLCHGNLHTIQNCYVPIGIKEIYCEFSLKVRADCLLEPKTSDPIVSQAIIDFINLYKERIGFEELASRYAKNILMGTWLWRNRHCKDLEVRISTSSGVNYLVKHANRLYWEEKWPTDAMVQLKKLTNELAQALSDKKFYWFADITAKLSVGSGERLYPSQLFKEDSNVSKLLATMKFEDKRETICFQEDKVGAAIQLIDDWWHEKAHKPLRVNEFGADKEELIARRLPNTNKDFYSLFTQLDDFIATLKNTNVNKDSTTLANLHYIMSVLCKGGLFQGHSKKKKAEAKAKKEKKTSKKSSS